MEYNIEVLKDICVDIKTKFKLHENRWYVDSEPHMGDTIRVWRDIKPFIPKDKEIVMHIEVNKEMTETLSVCSGYEIVYDVGICANLHKIAKKLWLKYTHKNYFTQKEVIDFDSICEQNFIYSSNIRCLIDNRAELTQKRLSRCFNAELSKQSYELSFPPIDVDYYVNTYGIVPGNTVWISPEARSERPINPVYWNMIANTMRVLGYYVVFNVTKSHMAHLFDGPIVVPPLVECVPFANLCGYVISQRSGLCDWLFFSKAKLTILYNSLEYGGQIASGFAGKLFEHAEHIKHVYFLDSPMINWFEHYRREELMVERNEHNSECLFSQEAYKSMIAPIFYSYHKHGFQKVNEFHFSMRYAMKVENARCYFSLELPDSADKFDIVYQLRDDFGVIKEIKNTFSTNISFEIPRFGNVFIRVQALLWKEEKKCQFDSEKITYFSNTFKQYLNADKETFTRATQMYGEMLIADEYYNDKQHELMKKYSAKHNRQAFWKYILSANDIFLFSTRRDISLLRVLFQDIPAGKNITDRLLTYEDFKVVNSTGGYTFKTSNFNSFLLTRKCKIITLQTEEECDVNKKLKFITSQVTNLNEMKWTIQNEIVTSLKSVNDFEEYILQLYQKKERYIIAISGKDAYTKATVNKSENLLSILSLLGCGDLAYLYRYSFLMIIDNGNVLIDEKNKNEELSFEHQSNDTKVKVTSCGYNVNKSPDCSSSIEINDIEYSVNKRGLNIVVWNKDTNKLVDSVCFDTFLDGKAYRL